jgi:hypothetical protein
MDNEIMDNLKKTIDDKIRGYQSIKISKLEILQNKYEMELRKIEAEYEQSIKNLNNELKNGLKKRTMFQRFLSYLYNE